MCSDAEEILGIGDWGVGGIQISVGKLAVYTAAAGIDPRRVIPVSLDVGTNNEGLLNDPLYLGNRHARVRGEAYDSFIAKYLRVASSLFPKALLHFEDFGASNARRILLANRDKYRMFNDDVQGTAAVPVLGQGSPAVTPTVQRSSGDNAATASKLPGGLPGWPLTRVRTSSVHTLPFQRIAIGPVVTVLPTAHTSVADSAATPYRPPLMISDEPAPASRSRPADVARARPRSGIRPGCRARSQVRGRSSCRRSTKDPVPQRLPAIP